VTTALVVVVAAAVVVVAEDDASDLLGYPDPDGTKLPVAVGAGISSEKLGTLVVEMTVMGWHTSLWPGQVTVGLMMGWREVVPVGCGGCSSEEEEEESVAVVMGQRVVETATVSVTKMMEDASVPDWQGVEAAQEVMVLVVVV
jgi:hypothetical protein